MRVSEVVALKVRHIDGERHLLWIEQGKGAKDRQVLISTTLLNSLRRYWQRYRPTVYLFPGKEPDTPLTITSAQKALQKAKALAGIEKIGGIHSLKHAYATLQLEASDLQSVMERFVDDYRAAHPLSQKQQQMCNHIRNCRAEALGGLQLRSMRPGAAAVPLLPGPALPEMSVSSDRGMV